MQRYFIAPDQFGEHTVTIVGDDARHLTKVMRARSGEKIVVCDGVSREAVAEIANIGTGSVEAKIIELRPVTQEPWLQVTVAQSLPKGDKMETVIQKCTEIGAVRFIPFVSERTIVQYDAKKETKRLERWSRIAKEAAEQAHRGRIPEVEETNAWKQLLHRFASYDLVLFCYEKEQSGKLRECISPLIHKRDGGGTLDVLLVIGPEGGFAEGECLAAEAAGAKPVGLGARILRTETAAMVGLTCLLYESGEMGGV
ncbi:MULTISPECIES: 16S rRNA (uracil(1498)-N(3))-methyltransferase [unclassified Paenibacillus]|uniref:RsmE family RNA methyltransferase n=1 Tax=unclassified Paenibacillus TaxID=185978 RepID=UPI001C0F4578|nr:MULTISPECIES: RsmE family RNA methyltransferase [unclassified Paenibacillus]MBU5440444.1 16S rRNA (uracil(1498)-N(3))-methyltransferase [Paenibacillus sp. MSJ-34]CAH0119634.1 Ribosomal RNA small subunit methyltransferase E [Paenibacillus sp. CECT 9249]